MTGKDLYYYILKQGYTQEELDQAIWLLHASSEKLKIAEADIKTGNDSADKELLNPHSGAPHII